MQNYELKAMFLKIKNGDRWGNPREKHSEFQKLKAVLTSTVKLCG
jgi:hypothetical protein